MRVTSSSTRYALAALTMVATFACRASAETELLNETFDTYADQAAFETAWPVFFNTTLAVNHPSMTLSEEQSVSPTKSAKNPGVTTAAGTAASPRNQRFFTDSGLPAADNLVHFEFDFYDNLGTGNPYRTYTGVFNSLAPSNSGGLVQMGMNNNALAASDGGNYYQGRVFGYDPALDEAGGAAGNGAFFKLNGFGTTGGIGAAEIPLRSLGWHKLGVTISDLDFKFYVDDVLSRVVDRAVGFGGAPVVVRSFDEIRLGAGVSNLDNPSYFDNLRVVLNPDPVEPPVADADFNDDTIVGDLDFGIWADGYGLDTGGTATTGDANDDGAIDGRDLLVWQQQFNENTTPPAAAAAGAIPEPAAGAMALVALAALAHARRSRS